MKRETDFQPQREAISELGSEYPAQPLARRETNALQGTDSSPPSFYEYTAEATPFDVIKPGEAEGLTPERLNPHAYGWDSLTEYLLDMSGYVPKPSVPGSPSDLKSIESYQEFVGRLPIRDVEESTIEELQVNEIDHATIAAYKQSVGEYRAYIKAIVRAFRQSE